MVEESKIAAAPEPLPNVNVDIGVVEPAPEKSEKRKQGMKPFSPICT